MNSLKRFVVAISLTTIIAGTALADCPKPGEVNGPPCVSTEQPPDESANQAATTTTISTEVEVVVFDTVIAGLEDLLTVY